MRHITCKDCGRRYDYDRDDFCPKCGSYNPPQANPSTQLERELLARFDNPGRGGKGAGSARQARTAPQTPPRRPAGAAAEPAGRSHGQRIENCRACGPETPKPRSGGNAAVLITVLVVVIILIAVCTAVFQTAVQWGALLP